jgi:hypothetical protein
MICQEAAGKLENTAKKASIRLDQILLKTSITEKTVTVIFIIIIVIIVIIIDRITHG